MVFYSSFLSKMLCISSCFRRLAVNLVSEFFLPMKHEYISRSFKTCQALPLTLVDAVDNAAVFGKGQQFHKIWTPAWAIKITYSNKKSALKSSQAKDKSWPLNICPLWKCSTFNSTSKTFKNCTVTSKLPLELSLS